MRKRGAGREIKRETERETDKELWLDSNRQPRTCITGIENRRRKMRIRKVAPVSGIFIFAEQVQHHADEAGQHRNARCHPQ